MSRCRDCGKKKKSDVNILEYFMPKYKPSVELDETTLTLTIDETVFKLEENNFFFGHGDIQGKCYISGIKNINEDELQITFYLPAKYIIKPYEAPHKVPGDVYVKHFIREGSSWVNKRNKDDKSYYDIKEEPRRNYHFSFK